MSKSDKFLHYMELARLKYRDENKMIVTRIGGNPSRFTQVENFLWTRYIVGSRLFK